MPYVLMQVSSPAETVALFAVADTLMLLDRLEVGAPCKLQNKTNSLR